MKQLDKIQSLRGMKDILDDEGKRFIYFLDIANKNRKNS